MGSWSNKSDNILVVISNDNITYKSLAFEVNLLSSKIIKSGKDSVTINFENIATILCNDGKVTQDNLDSVFVKVDPGFQLIDGLAAKEFDLAICKVGDRYVVAPSLLGSVELKEPSLVNSSRSVIGDAERLNGIKAVKTYRLKTKAYRTSSKNSWNPWKTAKNRYSFELYGGRQLDEESAEFQVCLKITLMEDGTHKAKWTAEKPHTPKFEIHLQDFIVGPAESLTQLDSGSKSTKEKKLKTTIKYLQGRWKSENGQEWEFTIENSKNWNVAIKDPNQSQKIMQWNAGYTTNGGEPVIVVPTTSGRQDSYVVKGITDTHIALRIQISGFAGFLGRGNHAGAHAPNRRMVRIPEKRFAPESRNKSKLPTQINQKPELEIKGERDNHDIEVKRFKKIRDLKDKKINNSTPLFVKHLEYSMIASLDKNNQQLQVETLLPERFGYTIYYVKIADINLDSVTIEKVMNGYYSSTFKLTLPLAKEIDIKQWSSKYFTYGKIESLDELNKYRPNTFTTQTVDFYCDTKEGAKNVLAELSELKKQSTHVKSIENECVSRGVSKEQERKILDFLKEYRSAELNGDWGKLQKMYANGCSYWNRQMTPKQIIQDKKAYAAKWVTRKEEIVRPVELSWGEGNYYCEYTTKFEMTSKNGDRRSGRVENIIMFKNQDSDDDPHLIRSERGKVKIDK